MFHLKFEIEEVVKYPVGSRRVLCRNTLEYNENVTFPYEQVMNVFRMLYPTKELVFNFIFINNYLTLLFYGKSV